MNVLALLFGCWINSLPGPPGVRVEDTYLQLWPVDKSKCPAVDPIRDISFHLFTDRNPLVADVLKVDDDEALANSHFNFSNPTVVYFHAFFEFAQSMTPTYARIAHLHKRVYNIILVSSLRLSGGPWYVTAAKNVRIIGQYTAKFIDYLVSKGLQLKIVHAVGFSLGAHAAGMLGKNLKSGKLSRITGLDLAGPLFNNFPKELRLNKTDAEFVDVIHTDSTGFGTSIATGHADFWPNGGVKLQPGCRIREIKKRNPEALAELAFCSHWRAFELYFESVINENGFKALRCGSWNDFQKNKCDTNPVHMGFALDKRSRGNYYLITTSKSPFSLP